MRKPLMLTTVLVAALAATLFTPSSFLPFNNASSSVSAAVSYQFPGQADDLPSGHYWYIDHKHAAGIQGEGYDISGIRYDEKENRWTRLKPGRGFDEFGANTKNEDWVIDGMPVYAIADGVVERCWRNAPENPRPGAKHPMLREEFPKIGGGGNSLWVRLDNGNYVLYAHFETGSIPASICPISKTYVEKDGDSEVPKAKQAKIKKGQFVGRIGNAGKSSNDHLHIHIQNSDPGSGGSGNAVSLPFQGAWIKNGTKTGTKDEKANTPWTLLKGQEISSPPAAILPNYSKGAAEVARHGVPAGDYQFTVDHAVASGYRVDWVDGFNVNGKLYFNVIFRPDKTGGNWSAVHNLTGAEYQTAYNARKAAGLRLKQVDSYPVGNQIRYAAVFIKDNGPDVAAYHGIPAADHQKQFDELTAGPWKPKNISVVSLGGNRFYTALYEKINTGSSQAKSFLTPAEYQQLSDDNKKLGRQLAYLNAYQHNGQPRFTAIWNAATQGAFKARHDLSGGAYQDEWEAALKGGMLTRAVTGYEDGNAIRYAAVWRK